MVLQLTGRKTLVLWNCIEMRCQQGILYGVLLISRISLLIMFLPKLKSAGIFLDYFKKRAVSLIKVPERLMFGNSGSTSTAVESVNWRGWSRFEKQDGGRPIKHIWRSATNQNATSFSLVHCGNWAHHQRVLQRQKSQSNSLLTNWLNFRSLLTATTLQQLLKSCDHDTKYLQTRELDLRQAVECVDFEKNVLESERLKYDEIFKHGTHLREQVQQLVDDDDNADFDVVLEDLPSHRESFTEKTLLLWWSSEWHTL